MAKATGTNYVPAEFRSRLRDMSPWGVVALLTYAMRHTECVTWAELLFAAESRDACPRERSDAFVKAIALYLQCASANGKIDPDGISAMGRACSVPITNGWYRRDDDPRKVTDAERIARYARYMRQIRRAGCVTKRDLDEEVAENVLIPEDRPLILAIIRAAKPTPQGNINVRDFMEKLRSYDIVLDDGKALAETPQIKSRLAALRHEHDAPIREAAARRRAEALERKDAETRVAEAARPAAAAVVATSAPSVPDVTPLSSERLPTQEREKTRIYVRRERNLTPKTEPVVIANPLPRDVITYQFLVRILTSLTMSHWPVPFIPASMTQAVAPLIFPHYQVPSVAISQLAYKGYLTNVAAPGAYAVWRLEPVVIGDIVIPEGLPVFTQQDANALVTRVFSDPDVRAKALAAVTDERYVPYVPVSDNVPDADPVQAAAEAVEQPVVVAEVSIPIAAPKPEPPPVPTIDQAMVDAAVREAVARIVPGLVAEAVRAELTKTVAQAAADREAHAARKAELLAELERIEKSARDARLLEEAATLVRAAFDKVTQVRM